ncbi:type VI secretion system-associated FHA domain protein TagH [Shewanella litoralis]|uniref:Peptide-binding protein n=1 Tax=Shewanella litoralis TaxID=2282700 RepID=A0ABQ2R8L0_9GAMM|nr:type VI secretion system-associated FHA domain protein TagH [Shewanella litoralis]GGQ19286.1 peptide-binding protein [Shewanella litoralis]
MELSLEIVSYHRLSPEQIITKTVTDSLTLGRSESCDWYLPDPEKVVSGTHAKITKRNDGFYIADLSTNGLYVNRAVDALGATREHKIDHDDLLTFGDYEISAKLPMQTADASHIQHAQVAAIPAKLETSITPQKMTSSTSSSMFNSEFDSDIAGFDSAMLLKQSRQQSAGLSEMNADLQDHFQPPVAIPEEWDKDIFGQNLHSNVIASEPMKPVTQEVQATIAPVKVTETINTDISKTVAAPSQSRVSHQNVTPSGLSQAFFKGLGINEQDYSGVLSEELMFELGQSMQLMLTGLMDSLRQRSKLKTEFRINQTTFQQRENNPLKFSANIDDVFQNLFLRKSASFLSSQQAITEAFNDGRKHDTALTAGTLGAIRGLLNQLDPDLIETKSQSQSFTGLLVPGQKQARQWKVYRSLHSDLNTEFSQDSAAALSDDFVKAYDNKIKTL